MKAGVKILVNSFCLSEVNRVLSPELRAPSWTDPEHLLSDQQQRGDEIAEAIK